MPEACAIAARDPVARGLARRVKGTSVFDWLKKRLYASEYRARDVESWLAELTPEEALRLLARASVASDPAVMRWSRAGASDASKCVGLPPVAHEILRSYVIVCDDTDMRIAADLCRPSGRYAGGVVVGHETTFDIEYVVMPDESVIFDDTDPASAHDRDASLAHLLLRVGDLARAFDVRALAADR